MQSVKLNLGCGHKLLPGFINIDMADNWSGKPPDVVCDLRALMFPDAYADEAQAIHVLEHFYRWEAEPILNEWHRVLKPGGLLVLEMPCFEKVMAHVLACIQTDQPLHPRMSLWAMYGDPNYKDPAMCHRWLWSAEEVIELMRDCGFVEVAMEAPQTHIAGRDMRITGRKP